MTRRNFILALLLVSVGVNLFLIGGISYRTVSIKQERDGRPLPPNLGWLVRDLSEERRSELDADLRASSEEVRPIRDEILAAQRRVNELLVAEPFDGAALESAFAELRAASDRYQAVTQSQTIAILEQLTQEERIAAQEFIGQRGRRDGRPGPGRRPPPGFPGAGPGNPPLPPADRDPQEPPQ